VGLVDLVLRYLEALVDLVVLVHQHQLALAVLVHRYCLEDPEVLLDPEVKPTVILFEHLLSC